MTVPVRLGVIVHVVPMPIMTPTVEAVPAGLLGFAVMLAGIVEVIV